ncbi:DEAD/DEAH box helicase [Candidatus Micrarchaeota archaeon]|nr:DEAD/DEAH box helicase [Candidatus Micrarchaeota archaeon]
MKSFKELGVTEPVLRSILLENFKDPTEIQDKSIPLILEGKDVIAGSATGSGKTLAFAAGIIKSCDAGRGIQALVMTPTRELSEQVAGAISKFAKFKRLDVVKIYGGVPIGPQIQMLKRADVVVGTPGRLLDHIGRRSIDLHRVKILVLDEADRMFDMGFIRDVEKIIMQCPNERQTLLFSATITPEVVRLSKRHMKSPHAVSAETFVDPRKLTQFYYDVDHNAKFSLLAHLLKNEKKGIVMVFCNARHTVDAVQGNLSLNGVESHAMHGGLSQSRRTKVLADFHANKATVLVCTDVAARGLDINGVTHVYNYDVPKTPDEYIHRIGRTARAGKDGMAVSLLSKDDHPFFRRIARDSRVKITKLAIPEMAIIQMKRISRRKEVIGGPRPFGRRNAGGPRSFERRESRGPPRGGQRGFGRNQRGRGDSRRSSTQERRF